jgi:hypothetical protein
MGKQTSLLYVFYLAFSLLCKLKNWNVVWNKSFMFDSEIGAFIPSDQVFVGEKCLEIFRTMNEEKAMSNP